jgi:hypothetical protein
MLGLENPAHPPSAELVENAVLIEEITRRSADEYALGLELRQDAALNQGPSENPTPVTDGQVRAELGQLFLGDQTAAQEVGQERLTIDVRGGRHELAPTLALALSNGRSTERTLASKVACAEPDTFYKTIQLSKRFRRGRKFVTRCNKPAREVTQEESKPNQHSPIHIQMNAACQTKHAVKKCRMHIADR